MLRGQSTLCTTFEGIECAFSQLARVLKPGGRAILIEEDFDHHPGYRSHADDPDSSLDTDALVEILGATNLNVATSHYKVGGVSALVISATKPTDRTVNGEAPDNTQTEGTTP